MDLIPTFIDFGNLGVLVYIALKVSALSERLSAAVTRIERVEEMQNEMVRKALTRA